MSRVRARYIADSGWADYREALRGFQSRDAELKRFAQYDEVVLWFEHDLYDQCQILQLLDWFSRQAADPANVGMICIDDYPGVDDFHGLGVLNPAEVVSLDGSQIPLSRAQLELGAHAWAALTSPDPVPVEHLMEEDTVALPFLNASLRRHLQQFPSSDNGLARTEKHLMEAVAAGHAAPGRIFA